MAQLKVRRLALSPSIQLSPLDGRAALQCKIRDGKVRRSDMAFEKGVEVPVELDLERQKHVDHQVEKEPALEDLMSRERGVARNLPKQLTIELVLEGRMLQAGVDQVLDGAEVMLEGHRLHRRGEIELKVLEEILCFCVEGARRKRGESLMETTRCPVENGMLPAGVVSRIDHLVLHDLREDFLGGRQFELIAALSRTKVVEPLLL